MRWRIDLGDALGEGLSAMEEGGRHGRWSAVLPPHPWGKDPFHERS
jgi:hypothetical protein